MSLRTSSQAPNFTAANTQGTIYFRDWIGNSWATGARLRWRRGNATKLEDGSGRELDWPVGDQWAMTMKKQKPHRTRAFCLTGFAEPM